MKRRALVPLFLLLPMAALADDPFACVDPDVAEAFLGSAYDGSVRYSTAVPPGLVDVSLPAPFELVGSRIANQGTAMVYTSGQAPDAALASSVDALEAAGWRQRVSNEHAQRGFQSEARPEYARMCRETGAGALTLTAREQSGRTFLSIHVHPQYASDECMGTPSHGEMPGGIALRNYLPNLAVPEDAQVHRNGSGGGGDEYNADLVISTAMSPDALLQYFGDQLREQGWMPDSAWSGRVTSGTLWTSTDSSDKLLSGTLRVAQASAEVFHVRFTVISLAPENYFSGHGSTVN